MFSTPYKRALPVLLLAASFFIPAHAAVTDALEAGFADPPDSAKPSAYWPWMGGYISREGITADLEAMKKIGMHAPMLFSVSSEYDEGNMAPANERPPSYVNAYSEEWWAMVRHAMAESKRLGMDVGIHNCLGWATSGGPWITPELSMQKLVWTRAAVNGPGPVEVTLELPELDPKYNFYREVAVVAVPSETEGPVVALEDVHDLSSQMDRNGVLRWDAPAGAWIVLRFGHTTTGKTIHPIEPAARGLETDKMNQAASEAHFNAFIGRVLAESDGALKSITIDSYEAGSQNWSPVFRDEFKRRRGYDPIPWLPVLARRPIVSEELSDRFSWDMDRTRAELYHDNFYVKMTALAHAHGLEMALEPYNGPFNTIRVAGVPDMPMAEFWAPPVSWGWDSVKPVVSGAHLYGKPVVGAEAFTADPAASRWRLDPWALKAGGDRAWAMGINRYVFHSYAHQPWMNAFPGMTMQWWGTHFTRTNTWWEPSAEWMRYIRRSQFLLQQGRFVADIVQLDSRAAQSRGYETDAAEDAAVLDRMRVRDGVIEVEGGARYHVLVLPERRTMTPQLAAKIRDFVAAGATVIGPRPDASPSLENHPQCDEDVRAIAADVWGDCDGGRVRERRYGKGRIVWGRTAAEKLRDLGVGPDVDLPDAEVERYPWTHRSADNAEIYFLSNQSDEPGAVEVSFRVDGLRPELWHADSGRIEPAAFWRRKNGRTLVPLQFDPRGSVFVVFRRPIDDADPLVALARDGRAVQTAGNGLPDGVDTPAIVSDRNGAYLVRSAEPGRYELTTVEGRALEAAVESIPAPLPIAGPWRLSFPEGWGAPPQVTLERLISWSDHPDKGVKYFSGTATYGYRAELPASLLAPNLRLYLDLGDVKNLAEVFVNGKNLGVLWKPPFRVDATGALKPGANELEIRVTNLWVNRLIGDEQEPPDMEWNRPHIFNYRGERTPVGGELRKLPDWFVKGEPRPSSGRYTFTTWDFYDKDDELMPSGLLGPVTLRAVGEAPARRK
jgi:hypothetical protein